MAKKQVQLQIEIECDEDWEKLLQREGLIVVDVYSEWCGPCAAMQANLKKIKMEYGGDNLVLAIACSDHITALERFRKKSEPTWMFLSGGKLVNLMFGANAPKLTLLMIEELQKEVAAKEDPSMRIVFEVDELTPEEKDRFDIIQKQAEEAEQKEILRKEQALRDRRCAVARVVLNNIAKCGVILVFPQARSNVVATLVELWEPAQISVSNSEKPRFTEAMIEELLYFADQMFTDQDIEDLTQGQALAYIVKHNLGEEFTGNMDEQVLQFIYGESKCPPGSPGSPAQLLQGKIIIEKEPSIKEPELSILSYSTPSQLEASSKQPLASVSSMPAQSQVFPSRSTMKSTTGASKSTLPAKSRSKYSKSKLFDEEIEGEEMQEEQEEEEAIEEDFLIITGIWAPPNDLTKATAIKLLFPKIYDPIALPEPVPTPPHIAIAFEAFKRKEVLKLISDYPDDIMRYGFFTDDNPAKAQLIAKTVPKFEKIRATETTYSEKLVIQLSRKRSEPWCAFAQLGPTYMSLNTVEGEEECKQFFGEGDGYDMVEEEETQKVEEIVTVKKKKKGKKHKEGEAVEDTSAVSLTELQDEGLENDAEFGTEEDGDGDIAENEEAESSLTEIDKATSPIPENE